MGTITPITTDQKSAFVNPEVAEDTGERLTQRSGPKNIDLPCNQTQSAPRHNCLRYATIHKMTPEFGQSRSSLHAKGRLLGPGRYAS